MTPPDAAAGAQELAPAPHADDAPARFAYAVGRLNRQLRQERSTLSHGLMLALSTVVRQGPIRPSELAAAEQVAAPTATRLIVELEGRGLVERAADPADGRSFFVSATANGVEAILEARRERAVRASELLDSLTTAERDALLAALPALEALASVR